MPWTLLAAIVPSLFPRAPFGRGSARDGCHGSPRGQGAEHNKVIVSCQGFANRLRSAKLFGCFMFISCFFFFLNLHCRLILQMGLQASNLRWQRQLGGVRHRGRWYRAVEWGKDGNCCAVNLQAKGVSLAVSASKSVRPIQKLQSAWEIALWRWTKVSARISETFWYFKSLQMDAHPLCSCSVHCSSKIL